MVKPAPEILRDLVEPSNISVRSGSRLVGNVEAAAAKDDKARQERGEPLRRKPALAGISGRELAHTVELTAWEVLHVLGRAMSLSRKGAGRGLAEHWGCLKYSQALTGNRRSFLALSTEGRDTAEHYKALQSGELGIGFGLTLAERALRARYPEHSVSIVPADTVLRAGWALTSRESKDTERRSGYRYRPQYFAEVWQPGGPSRVFPIACKGNHANPVVSHTQLASASAHVEAVHIGAWNETPALVFSTEIPVDGVLTVHTLQAEGKGGWLRPTTARPGTHPNEPHQEENFYPGIQPPVAGEGAPEPEPGYQVQADNYAWFQQVLARTAAAGLGAFAGDADMTASYLSKRQGRERFTGFAHAAAGSVQDAEHTLLGVRFVGTDHVFRLNGVRVEAFSGVAAHLFEHLASQRVEQYRAEVHAQRADTPVVDWERKWNGPVSVGPDGSVLAMRLLN